MEKVLKNKKILVVGFNTIDIVLESDEKLTTGKKIYAKRMSEYCGGQAANCAYTLAKMGWNVSYIGKFGDDENGMRSLASLKKNNIDVSKSKIIKDCKNHIGIIFVDELTGERTIIMRKDERLNMDDYNIDYVDLKDIDLVYSDGNESKFTLHILKMAREMGKDIVLDIERVDENIRQALQFVNALVAPGDIITRLADERNIESALRKLNKKIEIVIATLGDKGSVGISRDSKLVEVPAEVCQVKDTTGAGDAYHAGFISAMISGSNLKESMRFATSVARIKCEINGPRINRNIVI